MDLCYWLIHLEHTTVFFCLKLKNLQFVTFSFIDEDWAQPQTENRSKSRTLQKHLVKQYETSWIKTWAYVKNIHANPTMVPQKSIYTNKGWLVRVHTARTATEMRKLAMRHMFILWNIYGVYIWGVLCQKQVSRAGTSNYIPQISSLTSFLWGM